MRARCVTVPGNGERSVYVPGGDESRSLNSVDWTGILDYWNGIMDCWNGERTQGVPSIGPVGLSYAVGTAR